MPLRGGGHYFLNPPPIYAPDFKDLDYKILVRMFSGLAGEGVLLPVQSPPPMYVPDCKDLDYKILVCMLSGLASNLL